MIRFCLPKWKVGGKIQTSCTKDKLRPSDMTKPCSLLAKELKFVKELDKSKGKTSSKSKCWTSLKKKTKKKLSLQRGDSHSLINNKPNCVTDENKTPMLFKQRAVKECSLRVIAKKKTLEEAQEQDI